MAAVTPQMVKQLRDRTDQPMGLCKQALDQNDGDMDKAIDWLQSQNKKMQAQAGGQRDRRGPHRRRSSTTPPRPPPSSRCGARARRRPRATSSSRSPPTSPSTPSTSKAADVPALLAEPYGGGTVQDRINDMVGVIREKMVLHKFQRLEGGVYGSYVHHDGTVGVLVECKGTPTDRRTRCSATWPPTSPRSTRRTPSPRRCRRTQLEKEKAVVKADMDADPKMRRQAREHPGEDRRGQAVERGWPSTC